jgi:hypothetical protein
MSCVRAANGIVDARVREWNMREQVAASGEKELVRKFALVGAARGNEQQYV